MNNNIFKRSSVRQFTNEPINQKQIDALLKAAMAAPSAGNQQPWEFYIITDSALCTALAATSPYAGPIAKASLAIVVCYRDNLKFADYADIDCAIACENILLEAADLGLGGVMLGVAPLHQRMEKVAKVLNLPKEHTAFAMLALGYPLNEVKPTDRFNPDKVHYR